MITQFKLSNEQIKVISKRLPSGFKIVPFRSQTQRQAKLNEIKASKQEPDDDYTRFSKNLTEEQKRYLTIILKLKKHEYGANFIKMSQEMKLEGIEYMDLTIIENNIRNGSYSSILQFWADVRKVWQYAYLHNPKISPIYIQTGEIERYFNILYQELENPPTNNISNLQQKVDQLTKEIKQVKKQSFYDASPVQQSLPPSIPQPVKKNKSSNKNNHLRQKQISKIELPMSTQEKKNLGMNIRSLPPDCLQGIWEIVSDGVTIPNSNETIQFDLDQLDTRKCRELERYVNSKLQLISRQQMKQKQQQQLLTGSKQSSGQSDKTDKILPNQQVQQHQNILPQHLVNPTNDDTESPFTDGDDSI